MGPDPIKHCCGFNGIGNLSPIVGQLIDERVRQFPLKLNYGSLVISGVPNYLIFQANKAYPARSRRIRWNKCLTFRMP
jgi:hypothetical protein